MTFLNPLVLIGLAAAAIPLLIHLLGRRRPRAVRFSAMAFLAELRRQQFRRLQLRNWLLLALRTLTIVLLVLALARPAIRASLGAFGERGSSAMVCVLDDGPSMGYNGAMGRRLDWARRQLTDLVSLVGAGDWGVLLRTSRPDLVLPFNAETIGGLTETSPWSGDGMASLHHAAELLRRTDAANRELFVVTDLAGPPWEDLSAVEWPSRLSAYLLAPDDERTTNLSIDSLSVGGELVRTGRPLEIQAVVRNTGETDVRDAAVALWIDDRRVQQKSGSVAAGERLLVGFSTVLDASGWVTGRVELSDDPLLSDNGRWFALFVPIQTRLLIIGEDTPSRRDLAALFSSRDRNAPYVPVVAEPGAVTQQLVEHADVVLLNEHMALDDRAVGWIRDALRRGAGLVLLLGPESDLRDINRRVMPLIGRDQFTGLRSAAGADSVAYFTVDRKRIAHPLAAELLVPGPSSQPRFADYVVAHPAARNVLLSFNTGDPWIFFGEGAAGRGAVVTAGLNASWSDLAYRGIVVPLMHRLVYHLAQPVSLVSEYPAGVTIRRSIPQAGSRLEAESPDGILRTLLPLADARASAVDLPTLAIPGIWKIRSGGSIIDMFAVNSRPAESDLRALSATGFREKTGLSDLKRLAEDPASAVAHARRGTELDILFLMAALASMTAEMLLMRGIVAARDEARPSPARRATEVL